MKLSNDLTSYVSKFVRQSIKYLRVLPLKLEVLQNLSLLETMNLNRYWRKKINVGESESPERLSSNSRSLLSPLYITLKGPSKRKSCEALCSWVNGYYHLQRKRFLLLIPEQRAELPLPSSQKPVNLHRHCSGLGSMPPYSTNM